MYVDNLPYDVQPHPYENRLDQTVALRHISCACAGATALTFRLAMKLMDYNLMATITALLAPVLPDFKKAKNSGKLFLRPLASQGSLQYTSVTTYQMSNCWW